jgi:hypothetical protein
VILTKFLKIAMLQVVLDWQKIYKAMLEKALFFTFWPFCLFFGSCVEKFEKRPI